MLKSLYEGLLIPASVDGCTEYRFYETAQLETAARIKSYRQLGLSIEEIKSIFSGEDADRILSLRQFRVERFHNSDTPSIRQRMQVSKDLLFHKTATLSLW